MCEYMYSAIVCNCLCENLTVRSRASALTISLLLHGRLATVNSLTQSLSPSAELHSFANVQAKASPITDPLNRIDISSSQSALSKSQTHVSQEICPIGPQDTRSEKLSNQTYLTAQKKTEPRR